MSTTTTKASSVMEEASVLVEAINALCDEEKGGVNSLCCSSFDVVVVNDECAYTFDGPLHYSSKRKRRKTADASGNENDDDDDDDDDEDDDRDYYGIFVNMKTLRATTRKYLQLDSKKTEKQGLYVTRKWTKVFFEEEEEKGGGEDSKMDDSKKNAKATPTKLGIGVEGGFDEEDAKPKYAIEKDERIVVYDCDKDAIVAEMKLDFKDEEVRNLLPTIVYECAKTISEREGYDAKKDVMASWEDVPNVSKYSENLIQVKSDDKQRISPDPKTWKCFETGETTNLWLNLSDGVIGSGRRHFDGSGGNGSALRHYQSEKAKGNEYPLVVKLGTITPDGADVYSYAADEDDAVTDPKLAEHLKFWGIDIMSQVKTEQTMSEIQIDKNRTFEFDAITEHGKDLKEVSGEGLVGLKNLGNSCYVNSVVQVMKECANVRNVFANEKNKERVFETGKSGGAQAIENDPLAQTMKLFSSLTSSEYARTREELSDETRKKRDMRGLADGLAPRMFKRLVGEGHLEFSTARQQDAREFFEHCLEKFDKWQKEGVRESRFFIDEQISTSSNTISSISSEFQFETLERTVCGSSQKAGFKTSSQVVLDLRVPREKAVEIETTKEEEEATASKRQKKEGEENVPAPLEVPFAACLETYTQDSIVEDYYSPAIQGKTFATRKTLLKTCPNVLVLCVNRYYVGDDWRPKKMDCVVNVPERLNIESLRVDEKTDVDAYEPMPEDMNTDSNVNASPTAITADDTIVAQLVAMGFSENGSKRAAIATSNAGAEVAMEWVLAHSDDPDFNEPPTTTDTSKFNDKSTNAASVSVEAISQLEAMGFSSSASRTALRVSGSNNSVEAACEWLFANMDNIDEACAKAERELEEIEEGGRVAASTDVNEIIDGKGDYELFGVVSHMGSNTGCGHYVAHVKKNDQWILFNDQKVAVSENPPLGLGYLYFFRRRST